jgi:hypothetical protein
MQFKKMVTLADIAICVCYPSFLGFEGENGCKFELFLKHEMLEGI